MIDDVIKKIMDSDPDIYTLLFADNLALWFFNGDMQLHQDSLNRALSGHLDQVVKNELVFNFNKTNYQLFTLCTKTYDNLSYVQEQLSKTDCTTYLGIRLDCRLTWGRYFSRLADIKISRCKLFTGIICGTTQDVLCSTYKTYVRPVIEYGCELVLMSSDTLHYKLEILLNNAFRIITGSTCFMPIEDMQLLTNLEFLSDRRRRATLNLADKLVEW